jgi:hypothetical protein
MKNVKTQMTQKSYGLKDDASRLTRAALSAVILSILLSPCILFPSLANAQDTPPPADPPQIEVVPSDGFNLKIIDRVDDHYIVVTPDPPVHNWLAVTLKNLPTDAPVTIGITMKGVASKLQDGTEIKADVQKWVGLNPLMTYGDPTQYDNYQCYAWKKQNDENAKETEGWWCDDLLIDVHDRYGGNKDVPQQRGVPQDLAAQFLLTDKKHWEPWREVDKAEALPGVQVFRITQQFAQSTATIAMRVPYTYTYQQQFIDKLQAANIPGVSVDEIGMTPGKRMLQVIRVEPALAEGEKRADDYPSVLVYAREHATEQAGSWVVSGMLRSRLDAQNKAQGKSADPTWLFLPIEDPDGAAMGILDRLTSAFVKAGQGKTPPEALAYARYFVDYANAGHTTDLSITVHNIEASEGTNIFCPFTDVGLAASVLAFNQGLFTDLEKKGYAVGKPESLWGTGVMTTRLYTWSSLHFGSLNLAFEVNDRDPVKRLSLASLKTLGARMAEFATTWLSTPPGIAEHAQATTTLASREKARAAYLQARGPNTRQPIHELLDLAY